MTTGEKDHVLSEAAVGSKEEAKAHIQAIEKTLESNRRPSSKFGDIAQLVATAKTHVLLMSLYIEHQQGFRHPDETCQAVETIYKHGMP